MLDLLLDPNVIGVVYATGSTYIGMRFFRRFRRGRNIVAVTASATVEEKDPYARDSSDPFQCAVWEIRWFEQRLVDEKNLEVMDMTTCDDKDCVNCKQTRTSKAKYNLHQAEIKAAIERDKAKKAERFAIEQARKQRAEAKRKAEEKQLQLRREHEGRVQVDGHWVLRPAGVPDFAHGRIIYDTNTMSDYVHWAWTDRNSGKPMGCRSTYFSVDAPTPTHGQRKIDVIDHKQYEQYRDLRRQRRARHNMMGCG